tara:strand:- start:978 stop:1913 length:936 start_codon:yes stop_codon:yes gene_type:complete
MLPQIIAGLASFALAKASGASTRNALISGFLGGATSFGIKQLTTAASAAGTAGAQADLLSKLGTASEVANIAGGPGAAGVYGSAEALKTLTSSVPTEGISGFLTNQFMENPELAQDVLKYGSGLKGQVLAPGFVGGLYGVAKIPKYNPQFTGISDMDKEKRAEEYAKASQQLEGITTPREYAAAESQYKVPYSEIVFAKEGGIINALPKYNIGGVSYLPSKTDHDEKDINNYVRAQGYVEDGSGNGDKDEDTMLAQLADGEFVSRADAVLGAGIMAGANPEDFKEMRRKGAAFFYNQQDQMKRIYDLVNAN